MSGADSVAKMLAYAGFGGIQIRINPFVERGKATLFRALWGGPQLHFNSKPDRDTWLIRMGLLVKVKKGRGQRRNRRNKS